MEYQFVNAQVQFSNLEELIKVGNDASQLVLLGRVDAIVDYENLDYLKSKADIDNAVEKALTQYLAEPKYFHQLSVLTGDFVILQLVSNELIKIITSDSLSPKLTVYYRQHQGQLNISNDFRILTEDIDFTLVDTYDADLLEHCSRARGGLPGKTYLHEVKKLDVRSIYSITSTTIKKEAVIYPSQFRENMTVEDYISVVGKKLPDETYSLAYSTGIDSHVLLSSHSDKIDELCTYYFSYPNLGIEKTKASGASVIQAIQRGMTLPKLISVDECDPFGVEFLKHNASFQIYSSHLALNFYRLAQESKNDHLILGETADAMAGFFTHTNEIVLQTLWSDRKRLMWRIVDLLNFRRKMNKRYFKESLAHVLSCYDDKGRLKENIDLNAKAAVWPLFLYFKSSQKIMNSVATVFAAGDFFNKKIYCPYSEPLSHFAASQWNKSFASVFDPKIEIRKKYNYISDEEIHGQIHKPIGDVQGSILDSILDELTQSLPELSKHLKTIGVNKRSSVHIACLALAEE